MYESQDAYRIVAADGGGVRVVMPVGFATNAVEERYPNARAAAAAIDDAIKDGMPAFEVVDKSCVRGHARDCSASR